MGPEWNSAGVRPEPGAVSTCRRLLDQREPLCEGVSSSKLGTSPTILKDKIKVYLILQLSEQVIQMISEMGRKAEKEKGQVSFSCL